MTTQFSKQKHHDKELLCVLLRAIRGFSAELPTRDRIVEMSEPASPPIRLQVSEILREVAEIGERVDLLLDEVSQRPTQLD